LSVFSSISKDTIDTGIIILTVSAGAGRRSSGIGIIATIMLLSVFQYGCRSRVLKSRASICRRRTLSTISSHPQEMFDKQSIQMKANAYIITKDDTGQINTKKTAEIIRLYGFVIIPNLYEGKDLESLATTFVGKTDQTMDDLSNLLLKNDSKLKVGSKNGYHEICLRSPGRYDVSTQFSEFGKKVLTPIESVVSEVLGKDYATAFCGVVYSEPGSEDQQWHADSLHISNNHEEANLLNGLLALHDIDLSMGPTEFSPMSHLLTNHQTNEKVNGINIVYQHPENLNRPELVGAKKENNVCLPLSAGSVVLFDDRILHRGRGNTSNRPRYVGYFSYRRPWFEASTHFEATRSLYEDDEDLGYLVRSEFPALGDHYPSIFADGAGGSQVHHTVIDAVSNQLRHGSANLGGNYSTSELCLLTTKHARVAMSMFLLLHFHFLY
jgi:ectoine hydroxylase-related dioxygenase (phytanoyl-CoA dioxygenase family)